MKNFQFWWEQILTKILQINQRQLLSEKFFIQPVMNKLAPILLVCINLHRSSKSCEILKFTIHIPQQYQKILGTQIYFMSLQNFLPQPQVPSLCSFIVPSFIILFIFSFDAFILFIIFLLLFFFYPLYLIQIKKEFYIKCTCTTQTCGSTLNAKHMYNMLPIFQTTDKESQNNITTCTMYYLYFKLNKESLTNFRSRRH
eukprot:TRINITY_DN6705_c0_g2_i3.p2 TRINITY_DN6705_c0_g2~~TRINITY_DN6705_c0_g2_i3.p2  ORF type:complete len:199 (+),score=-15.96 TRINITY_DN6705_c0_g2_i3:1438-2034(+)